MFARTSGLLGVAVVLGTASASLVSFEARDVTPISTLMARQSTGFDPSSIPSKCQAGCSGVVNDISTCQTSTDTLCGCTSKVAGDMQTCFNCLISLAPTAQSSIQGSYDEYITSCNSLGANLPSGTVGSGSSGGGGGASSVGGSRASGTGASGPTSTGSVTGSGGSSGGSSGGNTGSSGGSNTGNTGTPGSSNSNAPGVAGGKNGALSTHGNVAMVSILSASFFASLFL